MKILAAKCTVTKISFEVPPFEQNPAGENTSVQLGHSVRGVAAAQDQAGPNLLLIGLVTTLRTASEDTGHKVELEVLHRLQFELDERVEPSGEGVLPAAQFCLREGGPWIQLAHNRDLAVLLQMVGIRAGPGGFLDLPKHLTTLADQLQVQEA